MNTAINYKQSHIREGSRWADIIIYIFGAVIALITLYPMYYVIILSVSEPSIAATMRVYLWPKGFFVDGYRKVFSDSKLWVSYRNTIIYAVSQTIESVYLV